MQTLLAENAENCLVVCFVLVVIFDFFQNNLWISYIKIPVNSILLVTQHQKFYFFLENLYHNENFKDRNI